MDNLLGTMIADTCEGALDDAVQECWTNVNNLEEHGGIILHHSEEDKYWFFLLRNSNTGTPVGPFLWTADQYEYATKLIPLFRQGWRQYASFHTHPQFQAWPSQEDLNVLFPGFAINYIFSPKEQIIREFSYDKPSTKFKLTNEITLIPNE